MIFWRIVHSVTCTELQLTQSLPVVVVFFFKKKKVKECNSMNMCSGLGVPAIPEEMQGGY